MMNLIIACLLSGVASLALGAIWYNPKVFGTMWMKEVGLTEEDAQKANMPLVFGLSFAICAFLAYEMKWVNHPDEKLNFFIHGMYHGARHVGFFVAGAIAVNALFEQKSAKYIFINISYWIILLGLIGGILASFPPFKEQKEEEKTETSTETGLNILPQEQYYSLR